MAYCASVTWRVPSLVIVPCGGFQADQPGLNSTKTTSRSVFAHTDNSETGRWLNVAGDLIIHSLSDGLLIAHRLHLHGLSLPPLDTDPLTWRHQNAGTDAAKPHGPDKSLKQ